MIVCQVRVIFVYPPFPVDFYVLLCCVIAEPIVTHVPCFTFAENNIVVNETVCGCVIGLDEGRRLGVSECV